MVGWSIKRSETAEQLNSVLIFVRPPGEVTF